ncbi:LysR family transcriptional regulator [Kordiimonas sp. SCSIO 12603]|uniref:LysR family transcriptional regulator n=1 Tax=Kordiimonas sp. SCSIO 12603 TaxID=2829596 RepID=UPI002104D239|nr:LysR family transcriptional regulator [Kordiimonas sp. SCSIO 12603]UTW58752.1 LysR family transcriptional regulator [Kordiimonas sp. SCSIO 12603]
MDITQIRTFLAIAQTGSFIGAANVVNVTQSTVSVRMRTLEDELRVELFERGKRGAILTPAGQKFMRTATAMARLWDQAKLDIGVAEEQIASLRIGGQVSLWQGYLIPWLAWMSENNPNLALRAHMADPLQLVQQLVDGALDIAVMYRPQFRPGFIAKPIFTEEIILVSSIKNHDEPFDDNYMLTYWGPAFKEDHALNFPEQKAPRLTADLGTMAIDYLLERPSTGFFPRRIAEPYIESGNLIIVKEVPSFEYPAYLVYPDILDHDLMNRLLTGLKSVAKSLNLSFSNEKLV